MGRMCKCGHALQQGTSKAWLQLTYKQRGTQALEEAWLAILSRREHIMSAKRSLNLNWGFTHG